MPTPNPPPGKSGRPTPKLLFNWEDWLPYLDAFDATEAEKRRFIETLWSIVQAFVDLGWEVGDRDDDPAESSGQVFDLTAELRAAVVDCREQYQTEPEKEKVRESV